MLFVIEETSLQGFQKLSEWYIVDFGRDYEKHRNLMLMKSYGVLKNVNGFIIILLPRV